MFRILIGIVGIVFAAGFMSVPFVFPVLLEPRTVIGSAMIGSFCLLLPVAAFVPRLRRFAVSVLSGSVALLYAIYLATALYAVVRSPRNFPSLADDLFGALCGSLFIGYPATRIAWHCVRGGDAPPGLPPFGRVIREKLLGELPERKTRGVAGARKDWRRCRASGETQCGRVA
ncbi:MAG: hypothetical protein H7145_24975 [Akkermansiaceae bacterium]|nr:hypothetical protein [Armatimonadota bacterium]